MAESNSEIDDDNEFTNSLDAAFKFLQPKEKEETVAFEHESIKETPHFQLNQYVKKESTEESPRLLDPDHPLLEKFQVALKEHLLKQIDHLQSEIFELETNAKKKNTIREQIGVEAYEVQQMVCKQQNEIEARVQELQSFTAAREQMEFDLDKMKEQYNQEAEKLFRINRKEMELRSEMESLNLLIYQMSRWESDIESNLLIHQRMSEKTRKDKIKLADEKRQLDMVIYKLMTEVWKLESELETIEIQLKAKEKDREHYALIIAQSNTDIEALESEHRCLLHSWQSVIVAIENRDKHYSTVNQEYQEINEKLQTTIAEISKVKKLCNNEMMQNERLTMFKSRIETDIKTCEHQLETELHKRNVIEKQMNNTLNIIDRIDKDIQKIYGENCRKQQEIKVIVREYDKLSNEKVDLELQILKKLQDQITNDKAAIYLSKLVDQNKQTNNDLEITLANTENQNAKVLDLMESQKEINLELNRKVDDGNNENHLMELEIKAYENEIKKCNTLIKKRQRDADLLNKKVETIVQRTGQSQLSPSELKIITLEKSLVDIQESIKEMQKFWLRGQGHLCHLSEERQEQIKENTLLKKQTMILEQRNLKITDELEMHKKKEIVMNRSIAFLYNKLAALNGQLCKKKEDKSVLNEDNNLVQVDYVGLLKDGELQTLEIEAELEELEEEKVHLSEELIEKNREALAWEKKLKLTLETKDNINEEKSGELGNIKAEIHRMNVRYGQLQKAQEKLIHDLEHCVSRREAILTVAEAREKRSKEGDTKTRVNFLRKLDDLRNKLKQSQNELEIVTKKLDAAKEDENLMKELFDGIQTDIESLNIETVQVTNEVERVKTDKQLNLEMLVLKQKKLKIYSELVRGKKPRLLFRTECIMMAEYERQKEINQKLLNVIENLLTDFPNHFHIFTRINNTLKLSLVHL